MNDSPASSSALGIQPASRAVHDNPGDDIVGLCGPLFYHGSRNKLTGNRKPMQKQRREFIKGTGILLSVVVAGKAINLSPREAHAAQIPYTALSTTQAATLDALAEALVPGSAAAGVSQFIDKQLAAPAEECLLMIKYLGVEPADRPGFYQAGLDSAAAIAEARFQRPWQALSTAQIALLLTQMGSDPGPMWQGPPASFFQFVLRSDACDVVYGGEEGFAQLNMPYRAHIAPAEPW